MKPIGLREALKALRTELKESIQESLQEDIRFEIGKIEMEFQIEIDRSTEGSGGVRFWVIELGGKRTSASSTSHTIKIPLQPLTRSGGPVVTGTDTIPE